MLVGDLIAVGTAAAGAIGGAAAGQAVVADPGCGLGGCVEADLLVREVEGGGPGVLLQEQVAVGVINEVAVPAGAAGDPGKLPGIVPGESLRAQPGGAGGHVAGGVVGVAGAAGGPAGGASGGQGAGLAGAVAVVGVTGGGVAPAAGGVLDLASAVAQGVEGPAGPVRACRAKVVAHHGRVG